MLKKVKNGSPFKEECLMPNTMYLAGVTNNSNKDIKFYIVNQKPI